jgi:ABC-type spermidine/putrescine transport system permease subunit II
MLYNETDRDPRAGALPAALHGAQRLCRLEGIDVSLEDAACSLGSTRWQAFLEVTLPLSLPGLAAGGLLCFVLSAGTYITPLVLGGPTDAMFANLVFEAIITQLNWPLGSALSLMLLAVLGALVLDLQPLSRHGPADEGAGLMGWNLIRLYTMLVYLFMFLPVAVVVLLSFNASQFGSFPMTGFSLRWFVELAGNEAILRAFRTSIVLGVLTAVISTTLGVLASLALVRYKVPGSNLISTLLIAPILVPEVVLAVALLLFLNFLSINKSFFLLLMGHVIFTLPFVILVVQARLVGIRREYEEARSVSAPARCRPSSGSRCRCWRRPFSPACSSPSPSASTTSPEPCSGNRAASKPCRPRSSPCCAIRSLRRSTRSAR